MRAAPLVGAVGILAAAWVLWPTSEPAPIPANQSVARHTPTPLQVSAPTPARQPRTPAPAVPSLPIQSLRQDCGLPATRHCEGTDCVLMLTGPDLDRFTGWMQLALQSPGLALATAARQTGMPDTACASTLRGIDAGVRILALEETDGAELWCAAPAGLEALCDGAAAAQPRHWHGSFLDAPRVLEFDR